MLGLSLAVVVLVVGVVLFNTSISSMPAVLTRHQTLVFGLLCILLAVAYFIQPFVTK